MLTVLMSACAKQEPNRANDQDLSTTKNASEAVISSNTLNHYSEQGAICSDRVPTKKPLFGDLHVHTGYSFDAYFDGVQTSPEDAYRFARGEEIPLRSFANDGQALDPIKIDRPLDFVAVTDHAEFLGDWHLCTNTGSTSYDTPFCGEFRRDRGGNNRNIIMRYVKAFSETEPSPIAELCGEDGLTCAEAALIPWQRIIAAAERADDKTSACTFTALVGYEHTGTPYSSNFHRNVIFRNAKVPELPISYIDAPLITSFGASLKQVV